MKYNELTITPHAVSKRKGRGIASGRGKTAGRGTKGQGSRTGSSLKPGFIGGQNPLMQKLPKLPGFRSHKTPMENVNTGQLNSITVKTIDGHVLAEKGLISSPFVRVKLILKGELTKAVNVELQGASAQAIALVEKAGGSFKVVDQIGRPAKSSPKTDTKKASVSK